MNIEILEHIFTIIFIKIKVYIYVHLMHKRINKPMNEQRIKTTNQLLCHSRFL